MEGLTCVVADVRLPGIDGIELQGGFEANGRSCQSSSSLLMMTADIRQRALRDGAVAFMVKPFDGGELLEHIARATNEG
jgi:FixJ family two-component response regulator